MQRNRTTRGIVWYLGAVQYGACLFVGGAVWFLVAQLTGFFGADPANQAAACLLLLALILAESLWAHMPGARNQARDFAADMLMSAAIAGFGMVVVALILAWLPR